MLYLPRRYNRPRGSILIRCAKNEQNYPWTAFAFLNDTCTLVMRKCFGTVKKKKHDKNPWHKQNSEWYSLILPSRHCRGYLHQSANDLILQPQNTMRAFCLFFCNKSFDCISYKITMHMSSEHLRSRQFYAAKYSLRQCKLGAARAWNKHICPHVYDAK